MTQPNQLVYRTAERRLVDRRPPGPRPSLLARRGAARAASDPS